MKLVEALLTAPKERGAGAAFGVPGNFALPVFKIARESAILRLHAFVTSAASDLRRMRQRGFAAGSASRIEARRGRISDTLVRFVASITALQRRRAS